MLLLFQRNLHPAPRTVTGVQIAVEMVAILALPHGAENARFELDLTRQRICERTHTLPQIWYDKEQRIEATRSSNRFQLFDFI